MNNIPNLNKSLITGALILALGASSFAQPLPFSKAGTGQPPTPPPADSATATTPDSVRETNAFQKLLEGKIPDTLAKGTLDLDVRARVEYAKESGLSTINSASLAPTVRTRLGYTTAPLYGFQAMVEGQNTSVVGSEGNYNAAGSNGKNYCLLALLNDNM
jgi:hypothetical protein